MTRRSTLRRALLSLAVTSALPLLLLGCPKKPPPAEPDSGPPPTASSSGPTIVAPLDQDAGEEDAAEAAAPHAHGGGNPNVVRVKQCCTALRKEGKDLGSSPEGNILIGFAAQCDTLATQGIGGNAPEFAAFRQLLKGHTLPAACSGL